MRIRERIVVKEQIVISRKDIIWGYVTLFFQMASGLITLPLILKMLSAEEIGMNYLMLTVGSLVSLFDFGFAPQFGRNITYVFAGAQALKKEGVDIGGGSVNYRLLSTMISVAKSVYCILAVVVLLIMLTLGTAYIYKVTHGFKDVHNSLLIWIVYSISVFFKVYYTYYSSLLIGKGLIMESKKAILASNLLYIILAFVTLIMGFGLLGISIANLIASFIGRYLSYKFFFTPRFCYELSQYHVAANEKWALFKIIWYNAQKLGLVFIGSYAINKCSMFLAGLYLSLEEIASYGLMIQLMTVVTIVSTTFFTVSEPEFAALRVDNKREALIQKFAFTMNIYYILFLIGCICFVLLAPFILNLIDSNTTLPPFYILLLYSIVTLLENNHSCFATFIISENKVPFVAASLLAGTAICVGSFLSLKYTLWGVGGLVLVQGGCQLLYANWKWPYVVCHDFKLSFFDFIKMGINQSLNRLKYYGK